MRPRRTCALSPTNAEFAELRWTSQFDSDAASRTLQGRGKAYVDEFSNTGELIW